MMEVLKSELPFLSEYGIVNMCEEQAEARQ